MPTVDPNPDIKVYPIKPNSTIKIEQLTGVVENNCPRELPWPCKGYIIALGDDWFSSSDHWKVEIDDPSFTHLGEKLLKEKIFRATDKMTEQLLGMPIEEFKNWDNDNFSAEEKKLFLNSSGKIWGTLSTDYSNITLVSGEIHEYEQQPQYVIFFNSPVDAHRAAETLLEMYPNDFFFITEDFSIYQSATPVIPKKYKTYSKVNKNLLSINFDHLLQIELAKQRRTDPNLGVIFLTDFKEDFRHGKFAYLGNYKNLSKYVPKGIPTLEESNIKVKDEVYTFDSSATAEKVYNILT